jgi:hypothetical protein
MIGYSCNFFQPLVTFYVIEKIGGRDRDRTCDPYHVKVVLSR